MQAITAETVPAMAQRIRATYASATAEQLTDGRAWYASAKHIADDVSWAAGKTIRTGPGLIAALSPLTSWSQNVAMAYAMATGETVRGLTGNIAKALRILAGEDFADVLPRGSKTWNFAHNISGDPDKVTVDRWAIRVAIGESRASVTPKQYGCIADAYRIAAYTAGETPAAMQAITWCVLRGQSD